MKARKEQAGGRLVLFANTSWYLANFRSNLIREFLARGYEVFTFAPADESTSRLERLGARHVAIPLEQRGTNPLREALACLRLLKTLSALRPDGVLTFTVKGNLYAGLCQRFLRFAQIANISGLGEAFEKAGPLRALVGMLYRLSMGGVHTVFFQNQEDMDLLVGMGAVSGGSSLRIPGSGVDLARFLPSDRPASEGKRVFLMFGRILPKKGYDLFLEAIASRWAELEDRAEFHIMGIPDPSRKESRELYRRILYHRDQGLVRVLEPREDVQPVLVQADVVVLPSQYNEGVPRVLLEALACGKPIITTDWKGCRDTVDDGRNGLLVAPGSAESLGRALVHMAALPAASLAAMSRASRAKAEEGFDEGLIIARYLERLREAGLARRASLVAGRVAAEVLPELPEVA